MKVTDCHIGYTFDRPITRTKINQIGSHLGFHIQPSSDPTDPPIEGSDLDELVDAVGKTEMVCFYECDWIGFFRKVEFEVPEHKLPPIIQGAKLSFEPELLMFDSPGELDLINWIPPGELDLIN